MGLIDSEEEEGVLSTAARAGIVEVCFLLAQPEVEGGRRTPRHPAAATAVECAVLAGLRFLSRASLARATSALLNLLHLFALSQRAAASRASNDRELTC